MKVLVLHPVESLREERSGYYVLIEMEELPAPLLRKRDCCGLRRIVSVFDPCRSRGGTWLARLG